MECCSVWHHHLLKMIQQILIEGRAVAAEATRVGHLTLDMSLVHVINQLYSILVHLITDPTFKDPMVLQVHL